MEVEARYAILKELAGTVPDFGPMSSPNLTTEVYEWLGRFHAVINHSMFGTETISVKVSMDSLGTVSHNHSIKAIMIALHRAIATVELRLPASSRGAFIPAGNAFDTITATAKILGEARQKLLIVDPYLGPKVLEVYALQASEGVEILLLGAKGRVRPAFEPTVAAWTSQYGNKRPLSVRLAPAKQLHDRLIVVDDTVVWDVSQSFEDLAARSPATLQKATAETAALKIEAYCEIFNDAEELN
jgi:hypothetical protein